MITNDRDGQTLLVQPHRGRWHFVKIVHEPLYQGPAGQTTRPTGREAVETVRYEALVKTVALLKDGELTHGDSRDLVNRGWGLELQQRSEEALAAISSQVTGAPQPLASG